MLLVTRALLARPRTRPSQLRAGGCVSVDLCP